jgi:hypothetical protein
MEFINLEDLTNTDDYKIINIKKDLIDEFNLDIKNNKDFERIIKALRGVEYQMTGVYNLLPLTMKTLKISDIINSFLSGIYSFSPAVFDLFVSLFPVEYIPKNCIFKKIITDEDINENEEYNMLICNYLCSTKKIKADTIIAGVVSCEELELTNFINIISAKIKILKGIEVFNSIGRVIVNDIQPKNLKLFSILEFDHNSNEYKNRLIIDGIEYDFIKTGIINGSSGMSVYFNGVKQIEI